MNILKQLFCKHKWAFKKTQKNYCLFVDGTQQEDIYICDKCYKVKKVKY